MIKLKSLFLGHSQSGASQSRKQRRRARTLRLESLDRREMMDGAGLYVDIPSLSPAVSRAEPPAAVASFSVQRASATIVPGSVRNESISRSGEVDRFTFDAAAGQKFQVALASSHGMNTSIRVISPVGGVILANSTSTTVQREFVVNSAGRVTIEVQARNRTSTGTYRLGLESLSVPSLDSKPIADGSVADGQLSGTIQADQYRVTAVAGQRFQVALSTQSGLNASFKVIGQNGNVIFAQNTNTALAREFVAPTAGTYIVQVQATNLTSTGNYRVGVESLSVPSADSKEIIAGSVMNGQLSGTIEVDQYRVTAVAGQRFQVALSTQSGLNASFKVIGQNGNVIFAQNTNTALAREFVAPTAGTFIVQVQATNLTSTGNYRVGVESLSVPSGDAQLIRIGRVSAGRLVDSIQVDQYRLTAAAGQRFQVALSTGRALNASFKVIGPSGNMIFAQNTDTVLAREFVAPLAGTYIIQVQATNLTSLGAYRVGIERLSSPSPNAGALSVGQVLSGQVTQRIQADQYKVSARAGQRFRLDLTPLAELNVRIRVFEPGGKLLLNQTSTKAATFNFNSNISGDFIVMVEAANGASLGNYRLGLRLRA